MDEMKRKIESANSITHQEETENEGRSFMNFQLGKKKKQ
jgi:hypothetical protein